MAVDKLVDSTQLDADLASVANAIRTKGGTSAQLAFPNGFVNAIGDIPTGSTMLKRGVLRPDAELVASRSFDQYVVADLGLTIPSYSTTTVTLIASDTLSPTVTLDDDYDYIIIERFLAIPIYNTVSVGTGRDEYVAVSTVYEPIRIDTSQWITLSTGQQLGSAATVSNGLTTHRLFYWNATPAPALYTSSSYGIAPSPSAPSYTTRAITLRSPQLNIRGHATYLSETYWNAMTDIRFQWVIDCYRIPRSSLNYDAWATGQELSHIVDCVNTTTHKLT